MKDARPRGNDGTLVAEEADSVSKSVTWAAGLRFCPGKATLDRTAREAVRGRHATRPDRTAQTHRTATRRQEGLVRRRHGRYDTALFPLIKSRRETRRPRTAFPSSSTPGDKPTAPERDSQLLRSCFSRPASSSRASN